MLQKTNVFQLSMLLKDLLCIYFSIGCDSLFLQVKLLCLVQSYKSISLVICLDCNMQMFKISKFFLSSSAMYCILHMFQISKICFEIKYLV